MIGQTVGNFEILSRLGSGGRGEVWLAQQRTLRTKAAIKILASTISNNSTHVTRFHNEAIAVSQIPHSGIVKIFDAGMLDGRAYLVMEYLQGETLASRIKRGRLELMLLCDFCRQIASVLDATHGAGITHRDLKPDNIFIVRDTEMPHGERIKVLDFGIAKLDTTVGPRMTAVGASSIGTPNYMSPEQWHSLAESDWRTDAYALGCVAFEMACGRPPFIAESRVEVCAMHLETPPPVPSSIRPGLPQPFDVVIARLLDKDPANRPTMREVMGGFTALGEQAGVMLSTLPPKGMLSPFADASDSFQYKPTPPAGFESQRMPRIEETRPREDATAVSDMSLQFRVTPRAFTSQNEMPAMTDPARATRGASQGMEMKAQKRRPVALVVGIGAVMIAAIVIAVIATRGDAKQTTGTGSTGSAVATGSGSAVASVGSGSGSATRATPPPPPALPPRIEPAQIPELASPLAVIVCINAAGEVVDVQLPSGATPDNAIEAKVLSWSYQARPGDAEKLCAPVTIPANAAKSGVLPERLTQKLFDNGVGAIHEAIFDCADLGSGTFTISVEVTPAGAGKVKNLALPRRNAKLEKCIRDAVAKAPFVKTKLGGKGVTTIQLGS